MSLGQSRANVEDGVEAIEPLHGGAVGARQSLRALDDRLRDRERVELERRDLLLGLHDRVQLAEARAEPCLVSLSLGDVAEC